MSQQHAPAPSRVTAAGSTPTTSAHPPDSDAQSPPHPYPGWQPTRGFDPHDPAQADGANKAFGHWFDADTARLTLMQRELDVGEQVIGSDHVFKLPLPFNKGVHVGAALTAVTIDGNAAFSARLEQNTLEESGSMEGPQTGNQLGHFLVVRFAPTEKGHAVGTLTFRATWADARVEEQRVRLIGRARDLNAAPTQSNAAAGQALSDARAAADQHALEEARYADPSWRNSHTPDGPRADFETATQSARTAAQKIAAEQNLGLGTVEKQVGTFKPPPGHHGFWMDLAELALSIATAGVAEVAAKKLALAIGKLVTDAASKDTPLVTGLGGIIKEQIKAAGHKVGGGLTHGDGGHDVSAADRIEFFEMQGRALIDLQHENAKLVDDRAKYLQPLLSTNPALAAQAMTALAGTFDETAADAVDIQKTASTAQWLAYRARLANGTQEVGRETVTDLDKARPAHPSTIPDRKIGVLELDVDVDHGVRVRGAYARGLAQAAAGNLTNMPLANARIPMRLVIDGNTPEPAIITRDEAGRVRVSGDFTKLTAFNSGEGVPATEIQAERAARALCEAVLQGTLADRGVGVITDDHAGRAA